MVKQKLPQGDRTGQYFVAWIVHARAAVAAFYRKRRRSLSGQTTDSTAAAELKSMAWPQFEALVGDAFRLQGFMVAQRGGLEPDGDVDLVLSKASELYLVQGKLWKATTVGADVVRALHAVMVAQGASGGFVVTSGGYTADAQALASARNVQLIDGDKLIEMIRVARVSQDMQLRATEYASKTHAPSCPACNAAMIQREAKYGVSAGHQFWSCTKFPNCRGTRDMPA